MSLDYKLESADEALEAFLGKMREKYPELSAITPPPWVFWWEEERVFQFLLEGAHREIEGGNQVFTPDYYELCRLKESRTEVMNLRMWIWKKTHQVLNW